MRYRVEIFVFMSDLCKFRREKGVMRSFRFLKIRYTLVLNGC